MKVKDLVEFIAKALVDNPEAVHVEQLEDERTITLELRVAADDMGKVIGKQGRLAKAIRTVVTAAAATEKKRVFVEIVQ